ncbi:methylated-DNA--[protein]-cysteine S-methyltransferase [Sediminibacillus halophilus]|uniref:Methylated-DNA--protein-cysteine methyltransferase n=1 Tax=Sediminibacillus halophilus TaxID=482461 RepID=A0A1G9NJZ4_9BACI|nr:methylated-DNA--[protein]-cysteine S-methyltransferase [Sediminibacillus halophilus]SDL86305.1 methylated-DNA-[protein]-cysteine S-methyltransferase [Sediminibacillus halophilus]
MKASQPQTIYYSLFEDEKWKLYLAATEKGLCYVGSPDKSFNEMKGWKDKRLPQAILQENNQVLAPYKQELSDYFNGRRKVFTFPIDLHGTAFQKAVWEELGRIPYGETYTYGQVAELIGRPKAVRAVAAAIGANPVMIPIPCHRVIGKNGKLTGFRGGLEMKQALLRLEQSPLSCETIT